MQIFIQVMESGNFTRAAAALQLPRSTVSTEIQALEDGLQVQLLQRTTRRMVATHDGLVFLETAREIVDAVEAADQMFRQSPARIRGRLRIDMPSRIGRRVVVPALPGFLAAHPGIEIELSMSDRTVDLVAEGMDCVVRVGTLDNSALICRKLGELELINCASPAYVAAHGTPAGPGDLAGHLLVNYAPRLPAAPATFEYDDAGTTRMVPMAARITVESGEAYIAGAVAGLGIIQIPAYDVQDLIAHGLLVDLMAHHRPAAMPLSVLYPRRRNVPPRIRAYLEWVERLLAENGVIGAR